MKRMHFRIQRRKRVGLKHAIPLPEFAQREHIDPSTVRYRLITRKLIGYKVHGRWRILPPELYEQLGVHPILGHYRES